MLLMKVVDQLRQDARGLSKLAQEKEDARCLAQKTKPELSAKNRAVLSCALGLIPVLKKEIGDLAIKKHRLLKRERALKEIEGAIIQNRQGASELVRRLGVHASHEQKAKLDAELVCLQEDLLLQMDCVDSQGVHALETQIRKLRAQIIHLSLREDDSQAQFDQALALMRKLDEAERSKV